MLCVAAGLAGYASAVTPNDECDAPSVKEIPEPVRILVRSLVNPNIPGISTFGGFYARTVLDVAVAKNGPALVELLLEKGANPNQGISYLWGLWNYPPLSRCANNAPLAKLLLEAGANPHVRVYSRYSIVPRVDDEALLSEAIKHGNADVIGLLLDHGVNPHVETLYPIILWVHESTLGLAAATGHLSIIRLLLDYGVDPTRGYSWYWDNSYLSPASIAKTKGHLDAADVLYNAELAYHKSQH
jgi:ankyrin repeat protein